MRLTPAGTLAHSPTDLANFLACRHKTALDLLVARGDLARPEWTDPLAAVLRERGDAHEDAYVATLRAEALTIVDLSAARELGPEERVAQTLAAMQAGADAIVQAPLVADGWSGFADILRRVSTPSSLGDWSYEVDDTKLSRETKGGTMLQLCVYSQLVGQIQGREPEYFRVITPVAMQSYRVRDVAAYYRLVQSRFVAFTAANLARTPADVEAAAYPSPTDHCDVCAWRARCNARRRADDHPSFVAGLGRLHASELASHDVRTLAALAALPLPVPFTPRRGARETYAKLREQARLQLEHRTTGVPVYELLDVDSGAGLSLLPEPSVGDLFLDLEGDPFAREPVAGPGEAGGREYLWGLWGRPRQGSDPTYISRWAFTDDEERTAFEATIDRIMAALAIDPAMHVYHYAPYECSALKRLAGRYATREAELDVLLRGGRFVDLYAVVRRALRAGVERYSIKNLEPFYGFAREVALTEAGDQRRLVEVALETNDAAAITIAAKEAVEGYNRDDCRSAAALRDWLERLRAATVAAGAEIARPSLTGGDPSPTVTERQAELEQVRQTLLAGVAADASGRTAEQHARYLLAYLLDWQYREDKVAWWEYFRLLGLDDDELLDEPKAVAGLEFLSRVEIIRNRRTGRPTGSVVDRYRFPMQELEIKPGDELTDAGERRFGTVVELDRMARTLDVRKGPAAADLHLRCAVVVDKPPPDEPARALRRIGAHVAAHGCDDTRFGAAMDLLLQRSPRIAGTGARSLAELQRSGESATGFAVRAVLDLDRSVLPIQGPPGSGKTYAGAEMICAMVAAGRRVAVTATSHKVIRNLLDAVAAAASRRGQRVRLGQRVQERDPEDHSDIAFFTDNDEVLEAFTRGHVDVLGGTVWLWAREDFEATADVLFVDEAGQMSLAFVAAASQGARSVVLLGDPQQLAQPQKGTHPDGVGVSALDHVLGARKTMPADRGIFLPETWRLAPAICAFTSEVFYEGRLQSRAGLDTQRLAGPTVFAGDGLFVLPVDHDGCRNGSDEEVAAVEAIVDELLAPGVTCVELDTASGQARAPRQVTPRDVLVVSPYNVQVTRLLERLERRSIRVGTVDKFQGQEAPVVIYSMATSRPEDAPRGLSFLYSLNRLNVATSRAKCACILVASPHLFEPECRTPREMKLAAALCRFVELAKSARHVLSKEPP